MRSDVSNGARDSIGVSLPRRGLSILFSCSSTGVSIPTTLKCGCLLRYLGILPGQPNCDGGGGHNSIWAGTQPDYLRLPVPSEVPTTPTLFRTSLSCIPLWSAVSKPEQRKYYRHRTYLGAFMAFPTTRGRSYRSLPYSTPAPFRLLGFNTPYTKRKTGKHAFTTTILG